MDEKKIALVVLGSIVFAFQALLARQTLTFEERVKAQEAIERVYYNHRIWPTENPTPKPPFEQMVPRAMLEAKVTDYLKKSAALGEFWQRPIQPEQLQAEMDRMAKGTQDSATLKELFAALNNDPHLIAECLARPVLADRLIHNWYANDERFHGETKAKAEAALASAGGGSLSLCNNGNYQTATYVLSDSDENRIRPEEKAKQGEIALDAKRFEREFQEIPDEGKPASRKETTEAFLLIRTTFKTTNRIEVEAVAFPKRSLEDWLKTVGPKERLESTFPTGYDCALPAITATACGEGWYNGVLGEALDPRSLHTAVWTGAEMIVWGGNPEYWESTRPGFSSGGRYNPSTDTWTLTSTGTDCPSPRALHTSIWTGTEMIVWGGHYEYGGDYWFSTGGRYNPSSDTWTQTSTGTNCPAGRGYHTAVWTGSQMIIWGGGTSNDFLNTGGRYSPATNTWMPTSTGSNCPSARSLHTAIWTGTEMIVWGGGYDYNTGARYNPSTNSWTTVSAGSGCPSGRRCHTAVWTGSEMIIWGGFWYDAGANANYENTGGRYNISTDSWVPTSTGASVPWARAYHTAVWTGKSMVVWGGCYPFGYLMTGGLYDPFADKWMPTSVGANCPLPRCNQTAIWTGSEMIVWGGYCGSIGGALNSGGRYDPSGDSWKPVSNGGNAPLARTAHTVVWTGTEMIVWGGNYYDVISHPLNSGGCYTPAIDAWTPTATGNNCPSPRYYHTAVWTGTEMIIWGGIDDVGKQDTGGRYDPLTDSWKATSVGMNVPSARFWHTAIWTGLEMIIWGGSNGGNTGSRYNPLTDAWQSTSTGANCPSGRSGHTAVWAQSEMIVWGGGVSDTNTGGRYSPLSDSWLSTSNGQNCPSSRSNHTAVWTGEEMIIWGGAQGGGELGSGGRYNPSNDTWTPMSTGANCPSGRQFHAAVWTGTEMIVWGGYYSGNTMNTGGRYAPHDDAWTCTPLGDTCPVDRCSHTAIWTGTAMIVWGGRNPSQSCLSSGGCYAPLGLVTVAPDAPTFVSTDTASVTLGWAAVTGASTYDVWRAEGDACYGAVKITATPLAGTTYIDTDLQACTQYTYYVVANNDCGPSANGVCASVTTTTLIPAAPAPPTFGSVGCTTLTVNWTAVTGATGYDLWRAQGSSCAEAVRITSLPVSGTMYNDSGLTSLTQYSYFVVASNNCGSSNNGTCASVTTIVMPAAPAGVSAIGSCGGVTISWAASANATSYNILRGTVCGTAVSTFTNVTSPYNDTTAVVGNTYQYWVVAVNACGTSSNSSCTSAARLTVPAAPSVPAFSGVTCSRVMISWVAVAGATSYDLWRATGATCTGAVKINGAPIVGTSCSDSSLSAGRQYSYFITANNTCGVSANGGCASVISTSAPAPTISGPSTNACPTPYVTLTASAGYVGYQWNFNGGPIGGATQNTYSVSLTGNYSVTAMNASGCSGTSAQKAVTETYCATAEVSPAEAPVPLRLVKDSVSSTGYYLYFQKASGATGYNIYEGTLGTWYSHANAAGNLCHATVTDLGTGEMRVAITPSGNGRYYLVTAYRTTKESPSGYDSNGNEIPASQSTCAP